MTLSAHEMNRRFSILCGLNPAELESVILLRNAYSELASDDALWEHFILVTDSDVERLHHVGMSYREIYQRYPHYRRAKWLDFDAVGRALWKTRLLAQVQSAIFQQQRVEDKRALNRAITLLMNDLNFVNLLAGSYLRTTDWVRWVKNVQGTAALKWVKTLARHTVLKQPEIKTMLWQLAFYHVTFETDALCALVEELAVANAAILQPHYFHTLFSLLEKRAITEPAVHELRFFLTSLRVTSQQAKLEADVIKNILLTAAYNMREAKKMIVLTHAEALHKMQRVKNHRAAFTLVKSKKVV